MQYSPNMLAIVRTRTVVVSVVYN